VCPAENGEFMIFPARLFRVAFVISICMPITLSIASTQQTIVSLAAKQELSAATSQESLPLRPTGTSSKVTLREGTRVQLVFAESLSSRTAAKGAPVNFVLASDIKVEDVTVAKAGCKVFGEVASVKKAELPGRSGALNLRLDYLQTGNEKIKLRGTKERGEEGGVQYSRPYSLKWPAGLLRKGNDVEIGEGTTLTAYVEEDIAFPVTP
jgi:hypothetical protein